MNDRLKIKATFLAAALLLGAAGYAPEASAASENSTATCTNASSCTLLLHHIGTSPRRLSCYWSQPRGGTQTAVRVLLRHLGPNNQPPYFWTLAFPVDEQSAASRVFDQIIQTNTVVVARDFNQILTFEFNEPLTTTVNCSYFAL